MSVKKRGKCGRMEKRGEGPHVESERREKERKTKRKESRLPKWCISVKDRKLIDRSMA